MPKRARAAHDASPRTESISRLAPATGPPLTLASEEMAASRNDALLQLWREEALCDCEVRVEGRAFRDHRVVLAASSSFTKSAFTVGLAETSTASVALEEMEAAVFEAVLEFVYAGTCTFGEPLALEVLRAASRLGIKPLEAEVVAHVTKTVDPSSCLSVWRAGDVLTLPPLVEAATKCAQGAFGAVAATAEFLGVDAPWLEGLLASNELAVDAEEEVFEALKRWHAAQCPPPSHEALGR